MCKFRRYADAPVSSLGNPAPQSSVTRPFPLRTCHAFQMTAHLFQPFHLQLFRSLGESCRRTSHASGVQALHSSLAVPISHQHRNTVQSSREKEVHADFGSLSLAKCSLPIGPLATQALSNRSTSAFIEHRQNRPGRPCHRPSQLANVLPILTMRCLYWAYHQLVCWSAFF